MTNLKKCGRLLILFALMLTLSAAVACGNGNDGNGEVTTQGVSNTDTSATSPNTESPDGTEAPSTGNDPDCTHENTVWVVETKSTCTEKGSKHRECTTCKTVLETVQSELLPHTEEIIKGIPATCTAEGLSDGKKCSVCSEILVTQKKTEKLPHIEVITLGTLPTCTESGLSDGKSCSVCSAEIVKQETIPALDHNTTDWIIDSAADVGVTGSKHTECVRCKAVILTENIPAIAETHTHAGSVWVNSAPATCSENGTKYFICECGKTMDTETVDKLSHTEVILLGKAPNCMYTGLTDGKKCVICGETTVNQTVIAKSDHIEEAVSGKAPTCTESGLSDGKKCALCTTTLTSQTTIPAKGHSFDSGSCLSCGISEPYSVWIVDGLGNPVNDIIVKIMKNGEQVKMLPYNGTFLTFEIEAGTYRIELDLSQTGVEYVYDESLVEISSEKRSATIRLFNAIPEETKPVYIGDPISKDYNAYYIGEGSYKATLTPNDYTFFIFSPKVSAIYTFTYECDTELAISYHGSSFFAQGHDLAPLSSEFAKYENGLSFNIYAGNVGGDYVFAVRSDSATSCVLNIKNEGETGTRLVDEPWSPYLEDAKKVEEQLNFKPEGTYKTIDLGDLTVSAVFNEEDGYYHLGSVDGPVIFIDLTSDTPYISSVQTICGNQRMGTYIYDINGNIVEKRSYNELFHQYGMPGSSDTVVEEAVRVPLTEKLAEAIKEFGDKNSWWAIGSEMNIFTDVFMAAPYNQEFAWLLFCGYYE